MFGITINLINVIISLEFVFECLPELIFMLVAPFVKKTVKPTKLDSSIIIECRLGKYFIYKILTQLIGI